MNEFTENTANNPNDYKGDLVDEMKETLKAHNHSRYKVLSESTETVIVRS